MIPNSPPPDARPKIARRLVRAVLPLLVLGAGVAVAIGLIETSPRAKRQPPARRARLVEVLPVHLGSERTVVQAMGTVRPAREVDLQARVSGQIIQVSDEFVPGGHFPEGDLIVQIDPADFVLAIRQREGDLAQAQSVLALELGQQSVAQREYEMLGEAIREQDRALVLRQPQLERARAGVQAAQAALDQARLNRERAAVRAPFNAVVRERHVNLGMQVTPAVTLASLTGTDAYWIEVTVPVDELKWIEMPGAAARVFNEAAWGPDAHRNGQVIRLLSELEAEGRMARLLVEVADPDSLQPDHAGGPRLLLGDYVRVEIEGVELEEVVAVNRRHIRNGDTVWVLNDQDQLEIREIEIIFRGQDRLLVRRGLRDGERLVTTDLAAPVEGMPLRTEDSGRADGARP